MGDFTMGGEWLLKNVPIFFDGKIQTSLNISIDGLQPTAQQITEVLNKEIFPFPVPGAALPI